MEVGHVPVLLKEAIDFLNVRRGGTYIDATVGLGGHSFEIAKRLGAPGHLIGFDKDPRALEAAKRVLGRWSLVVGEEKSERLTTNEPGQETQGPSTSLRSARDDGKRSIAASRPLNAPAPRSTSAAHWRDPPAPSGLRDRW